MKFAEQQRKDAEDLCLAYLDTGSFSDYLAVVTMGLMVGYAETCPDEVLSQLCSGELTIKSGILWNVENSWDKKEEFFEPFLQLKEQVKGDIEVYENSVDWVVIERLWNGCLSKLGIEVA